MEKKQAWKSCKIDILTRQQRMGNVNKEADAQHQFNQDKLEEALIETNECKTLDNQGQKDQRLVPVLQVVKRGMFPLNYNWLDGSYA